MQLTQIKQFAQNNLKNDVSGHDYWHLQRVANLAITLYQSDQPLDATTKDLLTAASFLHETTDEKLVTNLQQQQQIVQKLLITAGFSHLQQQEILQTINNLSFAHNLAHQQKLPDWGYYVQDADRLDALGAIGIARAFAYGGSHKQVIYDPTLPPVQLTNQKAYRQHPTTTINHFYEKLLHLKDLMHTAAGQAIAQQRTQILQNFLTEFLAEWSGHK